MCPFHSLTFNGSAAHSIAISCLLAALDCQHILVLTRIVDEVHAQVRIRPSKRNETKRMEAKVERENTENSREPKKFQR